MATPKTLKEVVQFASAAMTAQNFRDALPVWTTDSAVSVEIRRTHLLQGAVQVSFMFDMADKTKPRWEPIVRVNVPAFNSGALEASAFLAMFQELTFFAASLQMQLNDFIIPAE